MQIDITSRLEEAIASGKTFDVQLDEAEASGRPFGTVSDFKFGKHVIYHTPEEIADAQARTAAEVVESKIQTIEERVSALEAKLQ
jgi:hypothetical protein